MALNPYLTLGVGEQFRASLGSQESGLTQSPVRKLYRPGWNGLVITDFPQLHLVYVQEHGEISAAAGSIQDFIIAVLGQRRETRVRDMEVAFPCNRSKWVVFRT
jgi:hypothetical protein